MKRAYCPIILLAAGPFLASAAEPATTPAMQRYEGWVHIHYPAEHGAPAGTSHLNTLTGATWSESKSPSETTLELWDPATHEESDYHASTGLVRIGNYDPPASNLRPILHQWTTYQDVVDQFREVLGHDIDLQKIVHQTETGDDYYDFGALAHSPTADKAAADDLRELPLMVWLDPNTHLIRQALSDGRKCTFTYGGPDVTTIYDLGAPHTAKVYDNRPTAETLAVLDRLARRTTVHFPDGVYVLFEQTDTSASLEAFERSGKNWERRNYTLRQKPLAPGTQDLSLSWQGAGADAFFQRLATLDFYVDLSGDGTMAQMHHFKEKPDVFTGELAANLARGQSVEHKIYSLYANNGRQGLDSHVDLVTDPDRPGLVGLRLQGLDLTPDSVTSLLVEWIDAAHGDRLLQRVNENLDHPAPANPGPDYVPSERLKIVTDYQEFATLPAPDGRAYPTAWTETDYKPGPNGTWVAGTIHHHTFHFFPGRTLPPLKISPPAAAPGNLP